MRVWQVLALLLTTVSAFQVVVPPLATVINRPSSRLYLEYEEDTRIWGDEQWPLNNYNLSLDPSTPKAGNRAQQAPTLNLNQREVKTLGWDWWDTGPGPVDRERDPPSVWKRWKWMEGSEGEPNLKPSTASPYDSYFDIQ